MTEPRANMESASRSKPDWDALAPYWHCFELYGLNQSMLAGISRELTAPVLYVGGGRGSLVKRLEKVFGPVTAVDASMAMARSAKGDFGLHYIVADARRLPLPTSRFGSVLCSTGVLEYMNEAEITATLKEMKRVVRVNGVVVVAVFASNAPTELESAPQSRKPLRGGPLASLERWRQANGRVSTEQDALFSIFNCVAMELGDASEAYELLVRSLPQTNGELHRAILARCVGAAALIASATTHFPEMGVVVWRLSVSPT